MNIFFAKSSDFHYLSQKNTLLEDLRQYKSAEDWVNHLLAKGKFAFALHQFRADFPEQSDIAYKFALKRLVDKEQIISIHKGYYLIIPPQYRSKGILPPALFLNAFMPLDSNQCANACSPAFPFFFAFIFLFGCGMPMFNFYLSVLWCAALNKLVMT